MSCRGKAMHALGECDCYFKPRDFLEFLEKERQWFELLVRVRDPRVRHVVIRVRARWLRN
jgi:hypothetical protein